MEYSVQADPGGKTFFLSGQLTFKDHAEIAALKSELAEMVSTQDCIFDMSDLEFVDSSGLGSLIAIREEVEPKGIGITLRHPREKVLKIIQVCGFDTLFTIDS